MHKWVGEAVKHRSGPTAVGPSAPPRTRECCASCLPVVGHGQTAQNDDYAHGLSSFVAGCGLCGAGERSVLRLTLTDELRFPCTARCRSPSPPLSAFRDYALKFDPEGLKCSARDPGLSGARSHKVRVRGGGCEIPIATRFPAPSAPLTP